ncbi:MAG: ATP-binding cassette domain-containing protein, partial [Desulfobacterales bacterium]
MKIQDLDVSFRQEHGTVAHALRRVDLILSSGETHALVGESGSGKTVTATCIMGLLPTPQATVNSGQVFFKGKNLLSLSENEKRLLRGKEIAMIFQEPGKYLNPAYKIGEQIVETLMLHLKLTRRSAIKRALELLSLVGFNKNRRILNSYPHELSGGMKQR